MQIIAIRCKTIRNTPFKALVLGSSPRALTILQPPYFVAICPDSYSFLYPPKHL